MRTSRIALSAAARPQPYVLIAEDDEALRTLLQYNLLKDGFEVALACDGEEALLSLERRLPDLVILDWMMPKASGIEVCRRLRLSPAGARVAVIMLTARGEESDRVCGLRMGADDYVVKPFSMAEMVARAHAVMRRLLLQ